MFNPLPDHVALDCVPHALGFRLLLPLCATALWALLIRVYALLAM